MMEKGFIPLNYQSGEVLDLVINWSSEYYTLDSILFSHIDRYIKGIHRQIRFVNLHGKELDRIAKQGNPNRHNADQNGFRVETLHTEGDPQFLLFTNTKTYSAGFLINQNRLFDTIVKAELQEGLEFEYLFAFPAVYNSTIESNNLSYSAPLIPFFPEQTMQIFIEDQDLISDLIKRRSWIYGIASVMLLVAMLLGIILITRDIAREKQLANLRSDFISNVTHE
jgi:hypothetical protein